MAKQKKGPVGPGASPKTRQIHNQDATLDSGKLPDTPGANNSGTIDGVAGTGGSSGTGGVEVNTSHIGDTSGIDHPEEKLDDQMPANAEELLNKPNRENEDDDEAAGR